MANLKKMYNRKYNNNKKEKSSDLDKYLSNLIEITNGHFCLDDSIIEDYLKRRSLTGIVYYKILRDQENNKYILKFENLSSIVYKVGRSTYNTYLVTKDIRIVPMEQDLILVTRYLSSSSLLSNIYLEAEVIENVIVRIYKTREELLLSDILLTDYNLLGDRFDYYNFINNRIISSYSANRITK